ncbi:MAG: signal peptidase II [Gammaproteobacteria bacterium]|nr:signal peptidase II [Gammaproteobacteria bacterium]MCY4281870.1 signal peptidase II [Gammaproteobacteria bacterium]
MKTTALRWLWLTLLVIILDQVSKSMAVQWLTLHQALPVLPGFNLTLVHNTGAAFSFLSEAGGWQRYFFIALTLVISLVLLVWLTRLPAGKSMLACALALVLGGAAGNLWDRLHYGYVVDFLEVYYNQWSWPVFNIADSAITLGAALLILDAFRKP